MPECHIPKRPIEAALVATVSAKAFAGTLPEFGDPTIITTSTWAILIVVTGGLLLSFTPLQEMAPVGLLMGVAEYILGIYAALGGSWLIGVVGVGL